MVEIPAWIGPVQGQQQSLSEDRRLRTDAFAFRRQGSEDGRQNIGEPGFHAIEKNSYANSGSFLGPSFSV
ncbi:hypothetical protein BES34_012440 [Leptospira inadai serovar Lyme]|uniref:Uncharacterized protein n=1 Tax=Leptospira inadai serovar Lyme TaxID=293084 RepID=A0ABX4YHM7_9LEPT|nr:hypothetical protein BES34_012440 [Leptospira inadai serovar Lyme]